MSSYSQTPAAKDNIVKVKGPKYRMVEQQTCPSGTPVSKSRAIIIGVLVACAEVRVLPVLPALYRIEHMENGKP